MTSVESYARSTLRSAVLESLRAKIDTGELSPGMHLGEIELSTQFGVSRATLREALREMQQEGLLVQDWRGRLLLRVLDERQISDLFEVRVGLEEIAVRRLCLVDDRRKIVAQLREQIDALQRPATISEGIRIDLRFHELLCALSGNETLLRSWVSLSGLIRMTMISSGLDPARTNMSAERHAPIVNGIEAGDVEGTCSYLQRHMSEAVEHLFAARTDLTRQQAGERSSAP